MRWYDYLWFPWTVNKYLWEKLRPQKPQEPGRPPQMSCFGRALALAFGKTRLTGNIIYFDDTASGPAGVPLVHAIMAVCEGEIAGIDRVWRDKDVTSSPTNYGLTVYTGTRPTQTAWTVPPSARQLGYPGIAYVAGRDFQINASRFASLSYEVKGILHGTGGSDGDANPADIWKGTPATPASSMLCRTDYGAGFPWEVVTDTGRDGTAATSARRYVEQEGLWSSPAFTDQRPAREHLQQTFDATNCTALWTGGKLEIVPLGDTAVGTYTPYATVQYALEPGDFIPQQNGDLVRIEYPPDSDVFNVCPVEFLERAPTAAGTDTAHAYNVSLVDDPNPVDVAERGERRASPEPMHSICLRSVATKISRIRAARMSQTRARYFFTIPWRYMLLEPLDFVTISDPLLGLDTVPVRISSIEEDEAGNLSIEAVEWTTGVTSAVHTTQSSDGPMSSLATYDAEARIHELSARSWTAQTIPSGDYRGVAWSGSEFCAVGVGNVCATSSDGVTWASQTISTGQWEAVAWNGTVFCAVGSGVAATSPTGATWTPRSIPANCGHAITWNGSQFVAIGSACATSPDGTTWTSQTIPSGCQFFGVAWNGSVFCAVGYVTVGGAATCITSPDGVTWTTRTIPTGSYRGIAWSGSTFATVGGSAYGAASRDGITWEAATIPSLPTGSRNLYAITWTGGVFVATDDDSSSGKPGMVMTSRDGLSWTVQSTTLPVTHLKGIVFGGASLCGVGLNVAGTSLPF